KCVSRVPSPNDRIMRNICRMACGTLYANAVAGEQGVLSGGAHRDATEAEVAVNTVAASGRGAEEALVAISQVFGDQLLSSLPALWQLIHGPLAALLPDDGTKWNVCFALLFSWHMV